MYAKNDKRRLYQLMDMYVDGVITASVFCDEFYYAYDLEIADKDLTETERYMFTELDKISSRFSMQSHGDQPFRPLQMEGASRPA